MSEAAAGLAERVRNRFGSVVLGCKVHVGEVTVELAPERLLEVGRALRDEPEFAFEQLMDVCGVDYSEYGKGDWEPSARATASGFSRGVAPREYVAEAWQGPRFGTVYHLLSVRHNRRLRLKALLEDEPPRVPSVIDIWNSANWFEREAFDLFGILFEGHPDLRRILTDYGFVGHPFRKDFPLIGEVEMRYDPERQRVVYEPVSIEPRVLVPRVIVHDHRYVHAESGEGEPEGAAGHG